MINLPKDGDKVRIWPFPGRRVQLDERGVCDEQGGRYARDEGQEVTWSLYHLEAYRSGDFLLHDPNPAPCAELALAPAAVDEENALPAAAEAAPEPKVKRSKDRG